MKTVYLVQDYNLGHFIDSFLDDYERIDSYIIAKEFIIDSNEFTEQYINTLILYYKNLISKLGFDIESVIINKINESKSKNIICTDCKIPVNKLNDCTILVY